MYAHFHVNFLPSLLPSLPPSLLSSGRGFLDGVSTVVDGAWHLATRGNSSSSSSDAALPPPVPPHYGRSIGGKAREEERGVGGVRGSIMPSVPTLSSPPSSLPPSSRPSRTFSDGAAVLTNDEAARPPSLPSSLLAPILPRERKRDRLRRFLVSSLPLGRGEEGEEGGEEGGGRRWRKRRRRNER